MTKIATPFIERKENWALNMDFCPVLSLQAQLDKKLELYMLKAHVSETSSQIQDQRHVGDLNLEVKVIPGRIRRTQVNFGSPNPTDEAPVSQRELWEEIQKQLGLEEIPEAVIRKRGTIHKVPSNVSHQPALDGVDKLFTSDKAFGNRAKAIKERQGWPVANPYYLFRYELLNRNIIHSKRHPALKRIKSILATEYILPDNKQGYNMFYPFITDLQRGLRGNKFWIDTAIKHRILTNINSGRIEGRIYQLDTRRDKLIGL